MHQALAPDQQPRALQALQNSSVHLLQLVAKEPETLEAATHGQGRESLCGFLLHCLMWTRLVLGVSLHQASLGEEFRGALSVAVFGYGVTVRVLMLHALGRSPALSQAQLEVVFNCHEEVLEGRSCPAEEALQ